MTKSSSDSAPIVEAAPTFADAYPNDEDRLLPVKNRLESFWLTERDSNLQNARTTAEVPSHADVVIVGSGLTGSLMGYRMYAEAEKRGKPINIVTLEADEFCGSATARNGGHCKPTTIFGYRNQKAKHGAAVANQIFTFEAAALQQYVDIVKKEDIDCDLHVTRAFDVCFQQEDAENGKKDHEARVADWPEDCKKNDLRAVDDPKELEDLTGIRGGHWGASYPAGHLWPYKLAAALTRISLKKGLNLQTHTPALSLEPAANEEGQWEVTTSRGVITTPSVIVATNAFTSGFLPEFKELIFPIIGTACSITPAPSHSPGSKPGPIKYTYGFRHAPGEVDYMIPRQGRGRVQGHGDRSIILGGAKGEYLEDIDLWYNTKRDDRLLPGVVKYFEEYMRKFFVGWNGNEHGNVDRVWAGVQAYSSDFIPYVGEVPGKPGVFVSAGYTGHGMPRIPGCTAAVAALASARLEDGCITPEAQQAYEDSLPKPFWLTKERFESRVNIIHAAMGQGNKAQIDPKEADEAVMAARAVGAMKI